MINLQQMTLAELKDLAKENNIKNISKLKKEELITILDKVLDKDIKKEISKQQHDENFEEVVKDTTNGKNE